MVFIQTIHDNSAKRETVLTTLVQRVDNCSTIKNQAPNTNLKESEVRALDKEPQRLVDVIVHPKYIEGEELLLESNMEDELHVGLLVDEKVDDLQVVLHEGQNMSAQTEEVDIINFMEPISDQMDQYHMVAQESEFQSHKISTKLEYGYQDANIKLIYGVVFKIIPPKCKYNWFHETKVNDLIFMGDQFLFTENSRSSYFLSSYGKVYAHSTQDKMFVQNELLFEDNSKSRMELVLF